MMIRLKIEWGTIEALLSMKNQAVRKPAHHGILSRLRDGRPRLQATIEAVAEVGNPTVVATLTVVAALLPMLFVSGLMGPYMAPIPANASAAMLFSFFVAMVVAPWLMLRLAPKEGAVSEAHAAHVEGALGRIYRRFATPSSPASVRPGYS